MTHVQPPDPDKPDAAHAASRPSTVRPPSYRWQVGKTSVILRGYRVDDYCLAYSVQVGDRPVRCELRADSDGRWHAGDGPPHTPWRSRACFPDLADAVGWLAAQAGHPAGRGLAIDSAWVRFRDDDWTAVPRLYIARRDDTGLWWVAGVVWTYHEEDDELIVYDGDPTGKPVWSEHLDDRGNFCRESGALVDDRVRCPRGCSAAQALAPGDQLPNDPRSLEEAFGGWTGEHPRYRVADWRQRVAEDETRHGYWAWVSHAITGTF